MSKVFPSSGADVKWCNNNKNLYGFIDYFLNSLSLLLAIYGTIHLYFFVRLQRYICVVNMYINTVDMPIAYTQTSTFVLYIFN